MTGVTTKNTMNTDSLLLDSHTRQRITMEATGVAFIAEKYGQKSTSMKCHLPAKIAQAVPTAAPMSNPIRIRPMEYAIAL